MYDQNCYNSGDIVPDQVTPASDTLPLVDGTAAAGTSTEYSRGDHVHPLNVTTTIPPSDRASGSVGTTNFYARNDHSYPLNITTSIPPQDSSRGLVGTTNYYARNDHSHPINVETNASNIPIVKGVGTNGTSAFYARQDHVHLQQLTQDGNVTATKFIKTCGTASEVEAGGYIRLYVFPTGTSTGAPYIQFQIQCDTNAMQTIDLVPNYTVNGIVDLYSNITAPTYVLTGYNIYYRVDQLLYTHIGSYSSAVYTAWIHTMTGSGGVTVTVSKQSTYWVTRVTDILTQDIVTQIAGSQTQILISYDLGGSTTAINTTQTGQWEISKTNDNVLSINQSTLRQADHSVGLSIIGDCTQLKFNNVDLSARVSNAVQKTGQELQVIEGTIRKKDDDEESIAGEYLTRKEINDNYVSITGDQTITGRKAFNAQYSGQLYVQWAAGIMIRQDTMSQEFVICLTSDFGNDNRGLRISADGNTLTFSGRTL
ncbi:MAG: hypothetical protein EZS28_002103 [Streblomastix strix]|uniref:Uncharacterized protein n=1 Tax=Streblomastix strix TaxID=222440 RepID=A0A5J4X556_9EUKA|nr:MAG: hypothetical protein EZS28_002103 [Streblomastix strix]